MGTQSAKNKEIHKKIFMMTKKARFKQHANKQKPNCVHNSRTKFVKEHNDCFKNRFDQNQDHIAK